MGNRAEPIGRSRVIVDGADVLWRAGVGATWIDVEATTVETDGAPSSPVAAVIDVDAPGWDRFGGIARVAMAREAVGRHHPVVAVTDDADHALLRVRALTAGATHIVDRYQLAAATSFGDALLVATRAEHELRDDPSVRLAHRLKRQNNIDAGLRYVSNVGLAEAVALCRPANRVATARGMITLRTALATAIGLEPPSYLGAGAGADRTLASWREIVAVLNEARGARPGAS